MGAGIYIVWPAFYTDVTDAYRLDRKGRLRVDLGGIYFNALFVLLVTAAYLLTGFEPLLVLILVQHMQILQQLLPFLRLDGYYILSDLTGVPDMFARIKPTLKSALPGKENEEAVEELKPWVRRVTLAWIFFLFPVLLLVFGMLIFNSPRMLATAWDSLGLQLDKIQEGGALNVLAGVVQSLALVLPLLGIAYTSTRVAKTMLAGAWGWSEGAPIRRTLVVASSTAIAGVAAYVLFPNGEYRPIQASERGTVQGGVAQLAGGSHRPPGAHARSGRRSSAARPPSAPAVHRCPRRTRSSRRPRRRHRPRPRPRRRSLPPRRLRRRRRSRPHPPRPPRPFQLRPLRPSPRPPRPRRRPRRRPPPPPPTTP